MGYFASNNLLTKMNQTPYSDCSNICTHEICSNQASQATLATNTDEFVPSTKKENEKKISTVKKVGIATGVILGLVTISLIARRKLKAVTKLAENIEFTPAKTMEESKEFYGSYAKTCSRRRDKNS